MLHSRAVRDCEPHRFPWACPAQALAKAGAPISRLASSSLQPRRGGTRIIRVIGAHTGTEASANPDELRRSKTPEAAKIEAAPQEPASDLQAP